VTDFSPNGGKKDGKTAKQHVSQVNKVFSIVGEGTLLSLLEYSKKIRIPFFSNMQQIPRCQNQILPDEPTTLLLFLACRSTKWSHI